MEHYRWLMATISELLKIVSSIIETAGFHGMVEGQEAHGLCGLDAIQLHFFPEVPYLEAPANEPGHRLAVRTWPELARPSCSLVTIFTCSDRQAPSSVSGRSLAI